MARKDLTTISRILWHALESIRQMGLQPMARQYVDLSNITPMRSKSDGASIRNRCFCA